MFEGLYVVNTWVVNDSLKQDYNHDMCQGFQGVLKCPSEGLTVKEVQIGQVIMCKRFDSVTSSLCQGGD